MMTARPPIRSAWLSGMRAERMGTDLALEVSGRPPMHASADGEAVSSDVAIGVTVDVPGGARQRRLGLPAAAREKLERFEAQASAARSSILHLGDLLASEREQQQQLTMREKTWHANFMRDVTAGTRPSSRATARRASRRSTV